MEGDWGDFQSGTSGFLSAQNPPSSAAEEARASLNPGLTPSVAETKPSRRAGGGADAGMDFWGEVQALGGSGEAQALGENAEAQATDGGSGNDRMGQMAQGAETPLSPPPASTVDGGGVAPAAAAAVAAPLAAPVAAAVAASAGSGLGFDQSGLSGFRSGSPSVQTVASAGYHSSPMTAGGSHGPRSPTKADPHLASDPHYKHDPVQRPGAHHPSGFSAHMISYSHSSPFRPSAPHALDAHQRKSPTPPPPAGAAHPPFRGPAPAPGPAGPAPHSPLSVCGPLSAPPVSHPQSHPPGSHPLQSHPPFHPPPPHSPPSRSLSSHPPPSHPPPSLPHPLSHPPLSQLQSHLPQSHAPLSRPTHPPPRYRPPPQGSPGTAKPAGGATGGAAGGAGGRLPGGVIGVGVSAAAGGALMSGSGAPPVSNTTSTSTTTTTSSSSTTAIGAANISTASTTSTSSGSSSSSSAFAARSSPLVSFCRMSSLDVKTSLDGLAVLAARVVAGHSGLDKVVEGYKLAGWLILTLRSVFSMLQQPAAGIMEGIVDKVVEGYKLAGHGSYSLGSTLPLLHCMCHLVTMLTPVAGLMEGIVDKVVEVYKLAGLVQQLALHGYHVLALRMYGAAAEELDCWETSTFHNIDTRPTPACTPGGKTPCCPLRCAGWQQSCVTPWATRPSHWSDYAPCRRTAQLSSHTGATMRSAGILHSTAKMKDVQAKMADTQARAAPADSSKSSSMSKSVSTETREGMADVMSAEDGEGGGGGAAAAVTTSTLPTTSSSSAKGTSTSVPSSSASVSAAAWQQAALVACWARRRQAVRHALVSHHLAHHDYPTALLWLQRLLRYEPSNAALISRYGLVQLQLGDVEGASAAFGLVEKMVVHREVEMESEGGSGGGGGEEAGEGEGGGEATGDASNTAGAGAGGAGAGATGAGGGSDGGVGAGRVTAANVGEMKRLLQLNKALVHFARKEHGQALQLFTAVTKEDPTNSVAANNKALCLMYGRDLATAVQVLEDQLQASPLTAVDETVVLNLCSMYELAASDTLNAKSTLSNWLTRLTPDDFDFACTRL
ncbi:unnamed protein product [Closterium sp. NIES-54]